MNNPVSLAIQVEPLGILGDTLPSRTPFARLRRAKPGAIFIQHQSSHVRSSAVYGRLSRHKQNQRTVPGQNPALQVNMKCRGRYFTAGDSCGSFHPAHWHSRRLLPESVTNALHPARQRMVFFLGTNVCLASLASASLRLSRSGSDSALRSPLRNINTGYQHAKSCQCSPVNTRFVKSRTLLPIRYCRARNLRGCPVSWPGIKTCTAKARSLGKMLVSAA